MQQSGLMKDAGCTPLQIANVCHRSSIWLSAVMLQEQRFAHPAKACHGCRTQASRPS